MKTKTKLVVSICALTLIFTACKKDNVTPEPVLDCMEVENGVAVIDSCGDCQGAYVYNMATHDPSEIVMLGGDTNGVSVTLLPGQVIILPQDAGNPYWNAGCIPVVVYDCSGVSNGTAIIDDCDDCHKWTAYNYVTHAVREVNDTITEVLGANEMFASPNNPMNPLWNASCTDCSGILNGTAIIDDCDDCHKWTAYNYVTHAVREVNDTITEVLGANEMFASPNNPMNPLWNVSCK